MEEFDDIINKIRQQKTIEPPASLAGQVMRRLPDKHPGILFTAAFFMHQLNSALPVTDGGQTGSSARRECSFYFFITGFFYLVMGIILMTGIPGTGSGTAETGWIQLQPHLAIGTALWLTALGVLLIVDGGAGVKAAKYGTLFYVLFTVVNGILIQTYLHISLAGVVVIGLAAASALMGVMLARAVNKIEMRTV